MKYPLNLLHVYLLVVFLIHYDFQYSKDSYNLIVPQFPQFLIKSFLSDLKHILKMSIAETS